jgi:hypothetical protein
LQPALSQITKLVAVGRQQIQQKNLREIQLNTDCDAAFAHLQKPSGRASSSVILKILQVSLLPLLDWFNGQFEETFNGAVDDDGESNTLGFAGAQFLRGQTGLSPISGIMVFDEDDFAAMSQSESAIQILY